MMVNDEHREASGRLSLMLESESGECVASAETEFRLAALGQQTYRLKLKVPDVPGKFVLKATAAGNEAPTVSRRRVQIVAGKQ